MRVEPNNARRRTVYALRPRPTAVPGHWAIEIPMDYAVRCRFTYARNASFMRVCQPSPVDRKYSSTSGLYRTVTATLVACFCGPRWPGRRTLPFAQNAFTAAASLESYGHSGSFTLSGAAAMAAAICSLLKAEGFEVGARFMFVTITTGNHSGAFIARRPNQEHDAIAKPAQTLQALFAVMLALTFHRDHRGTEDTSDLSQINAVILEIPFALAFVPDNHWLIVVTQAQSRQAFRNYSGVTRQCTWAVQEAAQAGNFERRAAALHQSHIRNGHQAVTQLVIGSKSPISVRGTMNLQSPKPFGRYSA